MSITDVIWFLYAYFTVACNQKFFNVEELEILVAYSQKFPKVKNPEVFIKKKLVLLNISKNETFLIMVRSI
jgi:hypothetical protein